MTEEYAEMEGEEGSAGWKDVDKFAKSTGRFATKSARWYEQSRDRLLGGNPVGNDLNRAWRLRAGENAWLDWAVWIIAQLIIHVAPLAMLITYVIALLLGWVDAPFVDTIGGSLPSWQLWRLPLAVAIPAVVMMLFGPRMYTRIANFFKNPSEAGMIDAKTYNDKFSYTAAILGLWTIVSFVLYVLAGATVLMFLIWGMVIFPWTTALFGCFLAMNIISVIWSVLILLGWVASFVYILKLITVATMLYANKKINLAAKIGYFVATAHANKLKRHAGMTN